MLLLWLLDSVTIVDLYHDVTDTSSCKFAIAVVACVIIAVVAVAGAVVVAAAAVRLLPSVANLLYDPNVHSAMPTGQYSMLLLWRGIAIWEFSARKTKQNKEHEFHSIASLLDLIVAAPAKQACMLCCSSC